MPAFVCLRFHSATLEELAETDKFFKVFADVCQKPKQGIYRCSTVELAKRLGVKPYNIPRILYSIQHNGSDNMTYDVDKESYILEVKEIPAPSQTMPLALAMLAETRKIESALVSKLNCMYFVARKVSLPSIEAMLKKERSSPEAKEKMYYGFS